MGTVLIFYRTVYVIEGYHLHFLRQYNCETYKATGSPENKKHLKIGLDSYITVYIVESTQKKDYILKMGRFMTFNSRIILFVIR